jgi:hypothetical protein
MKVILGSQSVLVILGLGHPFWPEELPQCSAMIKKVIKGGHSFH